MNNIEAKLKDMHTDSKGHIDNKQLDIIFSEEKRIIVEAPAGYGKTKTMISRMAYLIATNQVPNPKKILSLTFSINAAYKIKRDISEKLPEIFDGRYNSPMDLKKKVFASNYHGFCRRILKLYGYLISSSLSNIDNLKCIDDSKKQLTKVKPRISSDAVSKIIKFGKKIEAVDEKYIISNQSNYLDYITNNLLPHGYITFNAILLYVLALFEKYPFILSFYRCYFPIVIIDEYQDTNILSNLILNQLIDDNTQLLIMGDPLQRIYGFIGAIPEIMSISEKEYEMHKINLEINHRFSDNPPMLLLDHNIRKNAENLGNPDIRSSADIVLFELLNQDKESTKILNETKRVIGDNSNDKVVILVRGWRFNPNTDKILHKFDSSKINYFNGLFNDDDQEYIDFHQNALGELNFILKKNRGFHVVSRKLLKKMQNRYSKTNRAIFKSLLNLLNSFLKTLYAEYKFLDSTEKIEFIRDTLENRALKQYLEYVDSQIIITTVHGAKGLEWDHVFIADMEKNSFPSKRGICSICKFGKNCEIDWNSAEAKFIRLFTEELSVFYVGSTRAKKQTKFFCSQIGTKKKKSVISCLLKMDGLNPIIPK